MSDDILSVDGIQPSIIYLHIFGEKFYKKMIFI